MTIGIVIDKQVKATMGVLLAVGLLLDLIAIVLGVAALFQRERRKLFAVLGIAVGFFAVFQTCMGSLGDRP